MGGGWQLKESLTAEFPLDPAITPELFLQWRSPRFGQTNPERMNNPVWEWLIRCQLNAFQANERLGGPDSVLAGACWCFDRFGQSSTELPDGRVVLIAGEHEDFYDPDFYIYNDVVVRHPDGKIDIFGYPRDVFPPIDFHSAALVGSEIVIIGNLGYPADRKPGTTPVFVLDLATFAVSCVETCGTPPGWIHKHDAIAAADGLSIIVRGGLLQRGASNLSLVENLDDWRLHLSDGRWERLTERRWQRWEVRRKDGGNNHLWELHHIAWELSLGWEDEAQQHLAELERDMGFRPNLDLIAQLYEPPLPHEQVAARDEDAQGVHRIRVNEVIVRYVESSRNIQMTIEGDLPQTTIDLLAHDLLEKFSALENVSAELMQL
jgi:hypothetical protein